MGGYTYSAYRVRSWGRLPRKRGATVVISNHQHDLDTMGVIPALQLKTPMRDPLYAATAKLMHEPGFMAIRARWVAPFFRRVNFAPIFTAIGMVPLENELSSKSIARIAWSVQRRHGPMPLSQIFKPQVVERFGHGDLRTDRLATAGVFEAAYGTYAKLTEIEQPYRDEIVAETRAGVEEDLERIESIVKRGGSFYVTPEGNYSRDGKMLPFRGSYPRASVHADVYVAAISYDPFNAKRMSQLHRIVKIRDKERVVAEVKVARPMTVSQLLGRWLRDRREPFTEAELTAAIETQLQELPPGLFVDPELCAHPDRVVKSALSTMTRLRILTRVGGTYTVGPLRTHSIFAQVDDMIAFQANMLEETLEAARELTASPGPVPA